MINGLYPSYMVDNIYSEVNIKGDLKINPQEENAGGLTESEKKEVQELQKRDREVKQHEQAHMIAGGPYIKGRANFSYKKGPDGKLYAVGGEVSIDVSRGNTPEETRKKADTIKAAALAPAKPSGQDRAVAAMAAKMKNEAEIEIAEEKREKLQESSSQSNRYIDAYSSFEKYNSHMPEVDSYV